MKSMQRNQPTHLWFSLDNCICWQSAVKYLQGLGLPGLGEVDTAGRSYAVLDETPNALIQGYSFDQTRIMNGISMLAGMQGKNIVADASLGNPCPRNNSVFQDQRAGGTISPASPAATPAARFGLEESLEKSAALTPSVCSLEALAPYMLSNWQDNSDTLLPTSGDRGYDTRFLTYSSAANLDPNGWTSSNAANLTHQGYDYPNFRNELSLSLATSPTTGQCSEVSSDSLEQASCSSKGVSRSLGSNRRVNFSQAILGSAYLAGIQEILAQIARYSLENIEQINCSAGCSRARAEGNISTSAPPFRSMTETTNHNADSMFEAQANSSFARHDAAESKKSRLLTLLQLVDSRYNQCLDEIHTVVSAFHAATELDPQVHTHFALKTISVLYKDLRERISNYILSMGERFNNSRSEEEKERSTEALFIEKHWALQQLKRKGHQLWRPQRGLPERSVSVLRAWMFQNFLHPYPKDAEKQLLAVKSGLTRSQVSNWFINARVRLWKPLIEEMHAEMNRRKALRNEEGTQSSHRSSRVRLGNQRFTTNSK
ncbi:homeobox protein ATH1 isoform X2 [Neltuma alba]|uniref:homeobox protein ATH1 isoform X2 n=1 Tax=Neltuma alba TaxID=207710 RepID=UPI0010A2B2CD|nr:homeobox protein ATH1-like isoform X2 [Prosopis alba]